MIESNTLNTKRLINNNKTKFINALFDLPKLRKLCGPADHSVRAYGYGTLMGLEDFGTPNSREDDGLNGKKWLPSFRFDVTKIISMLFGNVDFDLQNLLTSFQSSTSLLYGLQVYENNFGNVVSHRQNSANNYGSNNDANRRPAQFGAYIERYLEMLQGSFSCNAEIVPAAQCTNLLGCMLSSNPLKSDDPNNAIRLNEVLTDIGTKLDGLVNQSFNPVRETSSSNVTNPALVFFTIRGTETSYSYSNTGGRTQNISYVNPMRDKDGTYLALSLGDTQYRYSHDDSDLPEFVESLQQTGVFGVNDIQQYQDVSFANALILKVSSGVNLRHAQRSSHGYHDTAQENAIHATITADNHIEVRENIGLLPQTTNGHITGALRQGLGGAAFQADGAISPIVSLGPLVHMIMPDFLSEFHLGDFWDYTVGEKIKSYFSGHPANKQEWLNLKYQSSIISSPEGMPDVQRSDNFMQTGAMVSSNYIEPKDSIIRNNLKAKPLEPSAAYKGLGNERQCDKSSSQQDHGYTSPYCRTFADVAHNPFYGWTTINIKHTNSAGMIVGQPFTAQPNLIRVGSPIPGPARGVAVAGAVIGHREPGRFHIRPGSGLLIVV